MRKRGKENIKNGRREEERGLRERNKRRETVKAKKGKRKVRKNT